MPSYIILVNIIRARDGRKQYLTVHDAITALAKLHSVLLLSIVDRELERTTRPKCALASACQLVPKLIIFIYRFEKSLYDLIRGLRNHKGNEKEYIQNSLKECRAEIRGQDMG